MDGRIHDPASPQTKPPMPNLQKLAKAGALFTTTYSQSPQCVPSRSALMVGLRTDQIEVYDNFVGIAGVNGDPTVSDSHCTATFGHAACVQFARTQKAPPTFIDRLHTAGYNVSLHGKVHVGAGLDQYGDINAFPFNAGTSAKCLREWTRGLGPDTNIKGVTQGAAGKLRVPDNVAAPATGGDYKAIDECLALLRSGMFTHPRQFLYCSILVPHPPYATNATYMEAVKDLQVHPVQQVKTKSRLNRTATANNSGSKKKRHGRFLNTTPKQRCSNHSKYCFGEHRCRSTSCIRTTWRPRRSKEC